jgi:hypothetical protein
MAEGRNEMAAADFRQALAVDPMHAAARRNLEKLLANGAGPQ